MELVESVPNISEGRRLDVVERIAAAAASVSARPPPGPHERREPQPERAHPGRRGARRRRGAGAARRRGARRDRHGAPRRRAPADRRGRRGARSCPWRERRSEECVELARAFGRADRRTLRPAGLPVRRGRHAAGPGEAGRRAARPVRGSEGGDRRPAAGNRTSARRGCTRRGGATAVGARPFLIAWNVNLASADLEPREADRPPDPRVRRAGCPRSRPRGSSSRSWAAPRSR